MTTTLDDFETPLTYCTYCPSLCAHTCPVSTVEGNESVTPWGKMSAANHARLGRAPLTADLASRFYKCLGCRACSSWCVHDNDVEGALFAARRMAVEAGVGPFGKHVFARDDAPRDSEAVQRATAAEHWHPEPPTLLMMGARAMVEAPDLLEDFFRLCDMLDIEQVCLGEASRLDVGYDLWAGGYHSDFLRQADKVVAALASARQVIVPSPEVLYMLKVVYPASGLAIEADVMHTSEVLLPVLSGGIVERLQDRRTAYHDSCHLVRHLDLSVSPREILRRVLEAPLMELGQARESAVCCGGTGCLPVTSPETAGEAAHGVVELALEIGAERLVSFSPECVAMLRAAAGTGLEVDHATSLIAAAVRGEDAEV